MIVKQLKQLCILSDCFLFEGKVYERLYGYSHIGGGISISKPRCKYRFMISEDDYDYVVDRNLVRRLDRFYGKLLKRSGK